MPRIRTLKPEHRQHRKVGPLSDREYRLWVGMILEADDEGRLVCETDQLRAVIFGYHTKLKRQAIEDGLKTLSDLGLVRIYSQNGTRYAYFPSWLDHQKISHPIPSKLPSWEKSMSLPEDSRSFQKVPPDLIVFDRSVLDKKGSEGKGGERGGEPGGPRSAHALTEDQDRKRLDRLTRPDPPP